MSDEEKLGSFEKKAEEIAGKMRSLMNDPDLRKKVEEYQNKYGTMTEDDLRKRFTI